MYFFNFFLFSKEKNEIQMATENPLKIFVVGESGTGKSFLTNGMLSAGTAIPQPPPLTEADEGFWDQQEMGDNGIIDYGNKTLEIAEAMVSHGRGGNTLLAYEAAKLADCVIFCTDNSAYSHYGFTRVLSYISSSKNEKAKIILALTKSDLAEQKPEPLTGDLAAYPTFQTSATNHVAFLDFVLDTIQNGEPANSIRVKQLAAKEAARAAKKEEEEKKQTPKETTSTIITETKNEEATAPAHVQKTDKSILTKLVGLFTNKNGEEIKAADNSEIAPVA